MLAYKRSYSDSNAEYGVRSPAVSPLAYKSKAPHTGFEPASPFGPTVFKTAPSPPGHTAIWLVPLLLVGGQLYRGNEDRTHTCGIKIRCAAITLYPYLTDAERFELSPTVLETGMLPLHHASIIKAPALIPGYHLQELSLLYS